MRKTGFTQLLKYALSFALAGVLLYFSFRGIDWKEFAAGLRQTRWGWVLLSMCLGATAFVLRGLRWNQLLRHLDPAIPRIKTIASVCLGNLVSCIIPTSGDLMRCGVMATPKAGFDKMLGTMALERAWDILCIFLIYFLIILFDWGGASSFLTDGIWKPLVARLGAGTWLLLAGLVLLMVAAIWSIFAFRERNRLCAKAYNLLHGVAKGFVAIKDLKGKGWFLLYSALIWTAYWMMCVCILRSYPDTRGLGVMDGLFLMAVGSLQSMIPAPGGFGTYHYVIALALSSLYGFSWETGILFATLSHESQAITILLTGLWGYLFLLRGRKRTP